MKKLISRNVWLLSMVSLFTDIASEMLYPVMPVYLKHIGFSILLIGVLEGVAEATAGLSKGYFGTLSDNSGKRKPFVVFGYALSSLSRPLMAFFTYPLWIFGVRTLDRLGKGIRTGARDALLSDEATPETKGRVFGLHRSMDTLGAAIGPFCALVYFRYYPEEYEQLFLIAFAPGLIAIGLSYLIRERKKTDLIVKPKPKFLDFLRFWKTAPPTYKKLIVALLVFALFNSSDVFLLLKVKEAGYSDMMVIGVYIFYNIVYAAAAYPMGMLADKIGMKTVFITGLTLFVLVYAGMGIASNGWVFICLFILYGIYSAATEGIAKAWISNLIDTSQTATAIGTYTAFQSICTLVASSLAGFIWYTVGASTLFLLTAAVTFGVVLFVGTIRPTILDTVYQ
ncbi:MAG: MFS transporter [Bacteroidota bacterium]